MAYAISTDIDDIFGKSNVDMWADLNNNEDAGEITARRDWALNLGESMLNSRLTGCPYVVPFSGAPLSLVIVDLNARLAGTLLYDSRRIIDDDPSFDQLDIHRKYIEKVVAEIHGNRVTLDGEELVVITYPTAIGG